MSYLVLARKYRPQVFDDIVGQDHLTGTLTHAIAGGRVAHAYLFCGPRGVGKTTAARILAKALNCEKGPAPVPCNTCSPCVEITEGRSMDVLEIDGASNRGIDEVRELRENTRYAPTAARSKIYTIDEVHMLTKEAFNALLKTLEEPPEHVVFVFATTEPFKVPGTILSRCQRFDFARIPTRKIAKHLEHIVGKEKIQATPEALALIARRAQGGLRDALSLLDQIISAVDGPVERETVERMLGLVGRDFYSALTGCIARGDAGEALKLLDATYAEGADLADLAEGMATHFRDLLMLSIGDDLIAILEVTESEIPEFKAEASQFSQETLIALVQGASELAGTLRRSEHPRLAMELALAEMAALPSRVSLTDLAERLLKLERALGGTPPPGPPNPATSRGKASKTATRSEASKQTSRPKVLVDADSDPTAQTVPLPSPVPGSPAALWGACLAQVKDESIRLASTLDTAKAVGFAGDGSLRLSTTNPLAKQCLKEPGTITLLTAVLTRLGAKNPRVTLGSATDSDVSAGEAKPGPAEEEKRKTAGPEHPGGSNKVPHQEGEPDTRSMGQLFKDEPMLQKALDMFDGEVLP